ncbi:hypothetical protein J2X12_004229 [Pseudarthrobacter oxydans]|uniref:Uncharacterized protein n=1 Tax=Pseudarthrobacter oxydans TaxID=1671 RepID=A0AAW8NHF7_PSEOX|nr:MULTISPECIES: hypothetical protein [Micrococcaceae]MDR7166175.1 hypothetical protein [Pseudarthrobacter oxydans]TNB75625.1 hypothetical protein FHJ30_02940 [Arthrobacter sp. BB-1]VII98803.1 hypothetical protein [Arthrobacter sp. DR-2P]
MKSRSEELASYVSLAPEGFKTLAKMIDQSIQDSIEARKARGDRKSPTLLHGLIREGVIVSAEDSELLSEQGIRIRAGASDSILVQIKDAPTMLPLTCRPQTSRPAEEFLQDPDCDATLFPVPEGNLRLFYSVAKGRLGRLTITRTLSAPTDYYRDCQILDEIVLQAGSDLIATVIPEETRNDADDLSGLVRSKNKIEEEGASDAETGRGAVEAG